MRTDDALLERYSEELGLVDPLTLQDLINSHRCLRQMSKRFHADKIELFNEARIDIQNEMHDQEVMFKDTHQSLIKALKEVISNYE